MQKTKMITEGALMLAIYTVLLLLSLYVPVIAVISSLFLVLPFIIYASKYPLKYSVVFFISSVMISFLVGTIFGIAIPLLCGCTGIVMGWYIKERKEALSLYVSASLTFLVSLTLIYVTSIVILDMNMIERFYDIVDSSLKKSEELATSLGQTVDPSDLEKFEQAIRFGKVVLPSTLLITSFIATWLFIVINFPIIRRLGIHAPRFKPFREWSLPKSVIWYYLLFLILSLIIQPEEGSYLSMATVNVMYVLTLLVALQGFAFLHFLAFQQGFPKPVIVILTILLLPFLQFIGILGIIDLGFDLRERIQKK